MAEESLYDSEAMRRFAGIELGDDRIPDETTILNFRHLLQRHRLTQAIFAGVGAHLAARGTTLRSGTLVDATIIDVLSSTKNKAGTRMTRNRSPWSEVPSQAQCSLFGDSRMFGRMTAQWQEARAAVIKPEVLDVISRYNRWGLYERYECLSAFDYFKRDFETENGPIDRWPEAMAKEATKAIIRAAKLGCTTAPYGASGAILLCFFVELHQFRGRLAEELRTLIAKWHATELQDDMPSAS